MRVAILGQGRLGRTVAPILERAGHAVTRWSRGQSWPACEVAWITVSDGALAEVAQALPVGPVVLHASGASGLDVLAPHTAVGSLHPLLSFPGPELGVPPLRGAVAAIAGRGGGLEVARVLAGDLGLHAVEVPGDRRLYHAAAVLAGNFATVLLAAGAALLESAGVDPAEAPGMLAPLAQASVSGRAAVDPAGALTGPLARGDAAVVQAHIEALAGAHPELLPVYTALARYAVEELLTGPQGAQEALRRVLELAPALESGAIAASAGGAILGTEER